MAYVSEFGIQLAAFLDNFNQGSITVFIVHSLYLTRKTDGTHCNLSMRGYRPDASNVIGFCPVPIFMARISKTQTWLHLNFLKKQNGTVIPWHCTFMEGPNIRKFTKISAKLSLNQSPLQLPLLEASFSSTHQLGVQILPFQKQLQFCRIHIIIHTAWKKYYHISRSD